MPDLKRRQFLASSVASLAGLLVDACSTGSAGVTSTRRSATPTPRDVADNTPLVDLERHYGARLGVFAVDTASGRSVRHRENDSFALCSIFKTYAVAAVLRAHPLRGGDLSRTIHFSAADIVANSPVTSTRVATGTTVAELCDAAITHSDNTAGSQLLKLLGGPAAITQFARSLGDQSTRLDRWEPDLNSATRGDLRDTTTPLAIATGYRALLLGDALPAPERAQLKTWLIANTTGTARLRAGLPSSWTTADKTGAGRFATLNDVAITWPGAGGPLVMAVLSDRPEETATAADSLLAETARAVVSALTG